MNKGIIIGIISVMLLFAGGFYIANQQSQNANGVENVAMMQKDDEALEQKKVAMEKTDSSGSTDTNENARYVPYTKTAFDTAGNKRRVLYFYATWCPSCKAANADFTANTNKIPSDVIVIRTNYNDSDTDQEEKDLAKKYGITYQHTFVQVDNTGKEITKWNGGQTDELLSKIK